MSGIERPQNHNTDRYSSGTEHFRAAADLFDHTRELIEVLNETRSPNMSKYYFDFYEEGLDHVVLPSAVQEVSAYFKHPVDNIEIDIKKESFESISDVTFRFVFDDVDDESKTVILSSTWPKYKPTNVDPVTVSADNPDQETDFTIAEIPAVEINRCLASLCYPSTNGDYSQFDNLDITNGENYSALVDLFQKHAQLYSGDTTYNLGSDDEPETMGSIRYTDDNGSMVHASIRQLDHSDIIITNDGNLVFDEAASTTEIETITGASVSFHAESSTKGKERVIPTLLDYEKTSQFIRHHIDKLPQVHAASFEDITDDDLLPPTV